MLLKIQTSQSTSTLLSQRPDKHSIHICTWNSRSYSSILSFIWTLFTLCDRFKKITWKNIMLLITTSCKLVSKYSTWAECICSKLFLRNTATKVSGKCFPIKCDQYSNVLTVTKKKFIQNERKSWFRKNLGEMFLDLAKMAYKEAHTCDTGKCITNIFDWQSKYCTLYRMDRR